MGWDAREGKDESSGVRRIDHLQKKVLTLTAQRDKYRAALEEMTDDIAAVLESALSTEEVE